MYSVSQICRICKLSTKSAFKLQSNEATELLLSCTPEIVGSKLNEILKYLCENCVCQLKRMHDFKQQCSRTDQLFLDCCNKLKTSDIFLDAGVYLTKIKRYYDELLRTEGNMVGDEFKVPETLASILESKDMKKTYENIIEEISNSTTALNATNTSLKCGMLDQANKAKKEISKDKVCSENSLFCDKDNECLVENYDDLLNDNVPISMFSNEQEYLELFEIDKFQQVEDQSEVLDENNEELTKTENISTTKNVLLEAETKNKSEYIFQTNTCESKYKCSVCSKVFSSQSSLNRHGRLHTGDSPYKCYLCDKIFSQKYHLSQHLLIHTGEKPFKCDMCTKAFSFKNMLTRHRLLHTGESPHKCFVCDKLFNQKSHLDQHKLIHTAEKPFKCDICDKMFIKKSYLLQHRPIHLIENPYQCDVCSRVFASQTLLNRHRRIHTGDSPYKCDTCNRIFSQKSHLDQHKLTHTGEKPFKCDMCPRKFSQKSCLAQHRATHSRGSLYKCDK